MMQRAISASRALLPLLGLVMGGCGGDDATKGMPEVAVAGTPPADGDEALSLNGCSAADYEDRSDGGAERVVQIAVDGLTYTPRCMAVAVGQSVTFAGSLSAHPLAPGNASDPTAGSADNPIAKTTSGMSATFTFEAGGTFPFQCQLHSFGPGMGMAGAIYVR